VRAFASATESAPAAPEQPSAADSSEPEDEAAIAELISSIQKCRTGVELQKLVRARCVDGIAAARSRPAVERLTEAVCNAAAAAAASNLPLLRGSICTSLKPPWQCIQGSERQVCVQVDGKDFNTKPGTLALGHVVRRLRQIYDEAKTPWGRKGKSHKFAEQLCYEARRSMANMLPRTIANSLHYLHGLAAVDKLLLAKAGTVVSKRCASKLCIPDGLVQCVLELTQLWPFLKSKRL
jgi:hypothetical protein